MPKPMIDRTFVRVGRENQTVRQMSHAEFANWVSEWYKRRGMHYHQSRTETTSEQREEILAQMVENDIPPVMLRDDTQVPPG